MSPELNAHLPLHVRQAETLLQGMRMAGLTPQQTAEALHTAIFLLGRGNSLNVEEMKLMFAQEIDRLQSSLLFASRK